MATCEVCGNDYDKAFTVNMPGKSAHTFDSFECAITMLAPSCATCGVRVMGHGTESGDEIFCSAHCAQQHGVSGITDRV